MVSFDERFFGGNPIAFTQAETPNVTDGKTFKQKYYNIKMDEQIFVIFIMCERYNI